VAVAETITVLSGAGARIASMGESVRSVRECEPWPWTQAAGWSIRQRRLKEKYGKRPPMPKSWKDVPSKIIASLDSEVLEQCLEMVRLGLERKAIRLAYCGKLGRVYVCRECGRPGKRVSGCKLATCLFCANKNFDALFRQYFKLDEMIPAAVRSQPGCTWYVLDFSFWHAKDGSYPTRLELQAMLKVIRKTVQRAVGEMEWYRARQGCRLRFNEDGTPMMSYDGWPIAGAKDGEARELVGWEVFEVPEHKGPNNEARKRGERGAKKIIPAKWKLRPGYEFIRVREFGFDNENAHFHGTYSGPRIDYGKDDAEHKRSGRLICWGRLVDIFKEESQRAFGKESYTVFYEKACRGFGPALAHALKYVQKPCSSTGKRLGRLEDAMQGTRRVALLGAHYGVSLKSKPRNPRCSSCGSVMDYVPDLGLVLLSEIRDLPDVVEDREDDLREPGADEFMEEGVRGP